MTSPERRTGGRARRRLFPILGVVLLLAVAAVLVGQTIRNGGPTRARADSTGVDRADASSDSTGSLDQASAGADSDSVDEAGETSDGQDGDDGTANGKSGDRNDKGKGKKNGDDEDTEDPIPVEMARVTRTDVPAFFSGTATLEAENDARILAQISGQVVALHVEEGDRVREGQLLVELDGREQRIALEERTADLQNLKHEMNRQEILYKRDLGSESDYISTKARYEAAEARKEAAELGLTFTRIEAPFSGLVTQRMIGLGEHCTVGTELLQVADADPLLARIYMPEREVSRIRIGQEVRIQSDTDPGTVYPGRVSLIAPVVDRRTGTVKVTVELSPDEESTLRPGSFVRVFIETDRHPDTLTIPERAVLEQGGETFVFRIGDAKQVQRVRVETGYVYENRIEILSGLAEGDEIVTAGQGSLKNDSEVRVIGETDGASAADTGEADATSTDDADAADDLAVAGDAR